MANASIGRADVLNGKTEAWEEIEKVKFWKTGKFRALLILIKNSTMIKETGLNQKTNKPKPSTKRR